MIRRATPRFGFVALVCLSMGGCHDFETVGVLAPDAEAGIRTVDAANADVGNDARGEGGAGDVAMPFVTIDDCQATDASTIGETAIAQLLEGSESAGVTWLYPYDGTVFPGGLTAPLLMWSDGSAAEDAVYVHVHSSSFDYQSCTTPTAPGQLQLPQAVWALAGLNSAGAVDPFSLELRVLTGGRVLASRAEKVVIATGALSGSVYYQTVGVGLGSIWRVQPGQTAQPFLTTIGCVGCHSVSVNGSRMIASVNNMGTVFALSASAATSPTVVGMVSGGESPGLTADGALYVPSAHFASVGPKTYGGGLMTAGLYDTATGSVIPDSGVPSGAMVPAFSPDDTLLVFNDDAINGGRGLALMDFSEGMRTASNYRTLYTNSDDYPAWPVFFPDGRTIMFQLGVSSEFSGEGTGILQSATAGPKTDLYLVDAQTHVVTMLAQAMGFATAADVPSNDTYLPFGINEAHQNYAPTVSPATSGGYAWVFFDSMRHYGNVGLLRGIWGAAVDVAASGPYASDPSHPAFFLPGQGVGSGNFRPVAALDP